MCPWSAVPYLLHVASLHQWLFDDREIINKTCWLKRIGVLLMAVIAVVSCADDEGSLEPRFSAPATTVECGTYPWIVSLGGGGGFLFNKRYVMTVAHNIDQHLTTDCLVVEFLNACQSFTVAAEEYLHHSHYYCSDSGCPCDIAIVKLVRDVELDNDGDQPIEFVDPYAGNSFLDGNITLLSAGYAKGNELREVMLKLRSGEIVDNGLCPSRYIVQYAGTANFGDSGSPLFLNDDGSILALGVASTAQGYEGGFIYYTPLINFTVPEKKASKNSASQNNDVININGLYFPRDGWTPVTCSHDDIQRMNTIAWAASAAVGAGVILITLAGAIIVVKYPQLKKLLSPRPAPAQP